MKDKMTNADYDEALIGFKWECGVDNFDEAMMDLFDRYHPGLSPDRLVCMSYDAITFSLKVRDNLQLLATRTPEINELINRRLLNYRKAGKLDKRRERQNNETKKNDDLSGQMKMQWHPERPSWDKNG